MLFLGFLHLGCRIILLKQVLRCLACRYFARVNTKSPWDGRDLETNVMAVVRMRAVVPPPASVGRVLSAKAAVQSTHTVRASCFGTNRR